MSQQALDLRASVRVVRRHKILVGGLIVLSMLAGAGYALHYPPMLTSTAYVTLPESAPQSGTAAGTSGGIEAITATQEVVAGSDQVLANALPDVRPPMLLNELRRVVQVGSLTPFVISISAKSKVAADAEATANAVARSYVSYVASGPPDVRVAAQLFQPATSASGPSAAKQFAIFIGLGVVGGALVGTIIALAIGRGDPRLRERDEIADAIGVPVLASIPARAPRDAAGWTKLLQDYQPEPVAAWRLRKTLYELGLIGAGTADPVEQPSDVTLAVLSLASDHHALAIAPQFAAYAASAGISTALVLGPQQDTNATASLRAACAAPPVQLRSGNLQTAVIDRDQDGKPPDAMLTVVVAVVDGQNPKVADTLSDSVGVLGVSAGAATAGQLARIAASAAAGGLEITGILVADPDPADTTTGLAPDLSRPGRRNMPTRLTG